ncbi:helix-turn-helix domain-containing protein [Chromobacterium subtsugae]|uniref:helix-turn-helix domain-containing protein n=1 Tax=Chromobacterium subtsugae TaxID=251747 RepID=UPI000A7715F8|nr:helix-turn-helix domain-containing protein [Chromobacterium subtsugae]
MSGTEAAKALKIPVRALHRLIAAGELKGCQTIGARGKTTWLVERASVELFSRQKHGLLTLTQVESLLRVTPKRIRLLAEHGILKAVRKATDGTINSRHWLFKHADVNTLLEQLSHGNVSATPECAQLVSFWEITKRWMQGDEAFLELIRALYNEELPVIGRSLAESGLRALLISREAFRQWHKRYRLSRGFYTIPEAASHVGMDKNLLYHLAGTGLVSAHQEQYGYENKKVLGIRFGELERFTRDYVWGKRLGEMLGLSEHATAEFLLHRRVSPVCGPTLEGATGYIFRKADITSLTQFGFEEA